MQSSTSHGSCVLSNAFERRGRGESTPFAQLMIGTGSPPSNTNGSLPQAIGTASTRRRNDAASQSPSAASPPARSGSRKKKQRALPSTRCEPGSTPTPRPTCTSFSTSTPRKTSKPIARSSVNRSTTDSWWSTERYARMNSGWMKARFLPTWGNADSGRAKSS